MVSEAVQHRIGAGRVANSGLNFWGVTREVLWVEMSVILRVRLPPNPDDGK